MDLSTFRDELRTRVGVPTNDALYTDSVCTQLANAALHHIETLGDWRWLEAHATITGVGSQRDYDVPTRWRRTLGVFNADGYPLTQVDSRTVIMLTQSEGVATMFDVYGEKVRLVPVTSSSVDFSHQYVSGEVDLSADDDEPLLPAVWHGAWVEYAAYLGFRRWGKLDEAGGAKASFDDWLSKMRSDPGSSAYTNEPGGGQETQQAPQAGK